MPCYFPNIAYQSKWLKSNGRHMISFNAADDFSFEQIRLPCKNCSGCRLDKARVWATRCVMESTLWQRNCFITLTYNNKWLPSDWSLQRDEFPLFMKRFRKKFGSGVRYYHCGEYGDKFGRPHYHAILFNFDFEDKKFHKMSGDHPLYVSNELSKLWKFGFSSVGSMTFDSACYVARYCMKKINGKLSFDHYLSHVDLDTGEFVLREREYSTMSRRPGIAKGWYDKYKSDVYSKDFLMFNDKKIRPPSYFDRLFEHEYPDDFLILKQKRKENVYKHESLDRLKVIAEVKRLNDEFFKERDSDL